MSGSRWNTPALILALAIAMTACDSSSGGNATHKTAPNTAISDSALTVTTVAPQTQRWAQRVWASGSIVPVQQNDIAAPGDGSPFATVNVRVGDAVRAGQVLATMNVANVRLRRSQALADLVEATANLKQADAQLVGANQLNDLGAISRQAFVAAQTNARIGVAHLKSARARLASVDLELGASTLRAPSDAIVASSHAIPGSVPAAGSPAFTLVSGDRLEWRAQVDMRAIASIRKRQRAEVSCPAGGVVAGEVSRISPLLDTTTQMGTVYVELLATGALKIGSVVSGTIIGERAEVLSLPESSVSTHDGFDYAWTVGDANRVHEIKLDTGRRQDGRVEVLGGLPSGIRVVTNGVGLLNEGDAVTVGQARDDTQTAAR